jgi:aminopeptidase
VPPDRFNCDRVRAELAVDPGAARLEEVALVDGSSAVGRSGGVFNYGLIDENATCHIALGNAYPHTMPGLPDDHDAQVALGFKRSACHDDMSSAAAHRSSLPTITSLVGL